MHDRELLLEQLERLAIVLDELMPRCAELVRDAIALLKEQDSVEYALDVLRRNGWKDDSYGDLLKEQEAKWVYGEDETGVDGWYCSECNFFEPWFYDFDDDIDFIKRYEHCPKCGRKMTSYTGNARTAAVAQGVIHPHSQKWHP